MCKIWTTLCLAVVYPFIDSSDWQKWALSHWSGLSSHLQILFLKSIWKSHRFFWLETEYEPIVTSASSFLLVWLFRNIPDLQWPNRWNWGDLEPWHYLLKSLESQLADLYIVFINKREIYFIDCVRFDRIEFEMWLMSVWQTVMWSQLKNNTWAYAIPLLHLDCSGDSMWNRKIDLYTKSPRQYPVLLKSYGFASSVKIKVMNRKT
jgi:hypothetical protein